MKKLMPSEGLRLGCSSGSTRCVIAKNYVLGQPGGVTFSPSGMSPPFKGGREGLKTMTKKETWKFLIQTLISILTAISTTLGVTSCMVPVMA